MCEFHSYVRDLFMCDMIDPCVLDSFLFASLIHMCEFHSYVRDLFICEMTHSFV